MNLWQRWVLTTLALIPFTLGWLAGACVRFTLWLVAAIVAGYKAGRGGGEE